MEISDTVLSLPSVEQLEAGHFDLEELVDKLTGLLADESQRNEILSLTGDVALLVIECLDKVGASGSEFCIPSAYHAVDYLF